MKDTRKRQHSFARRGGVSGLAMLSLATAGLFVAALTAPGSAATGVSSSSSAKLAATADAATKAILAQSRGDKSSGGKSASGGRSGGGKSAGGSSRPSGRSASSSSRSSRGSSGRSASPPRRSSPSAAPPQRSGPSSRDIQRQRQYERQRQLERQRALDAQRQRNIEAQRRIEDVRRRAAESREFDQRRDAQTRALREQQLEELRRRAADYARQRLADQNQRDLGSRSQPSSRRSYYDDRQTATLRARLQELLRKQNSNAFRDDPTRPDSGSLSRSVPSPNSRDDIRRSDSTRRNPAPLGRAGQTPPPSSSVSGLKPFTVVDDEGLPVRKTAMPGSRQSATTREALIDKAEQFTRHKPTGLEALTSPIASSSTAAERAADVIAGRAASDTPFSRALASRPSENWAGERYDDDHRWDDDYHHDHHVHHHHYHHGHHSGFFIHFGLSFGFHYGHHYGYHHYGHYYHHPYHHYGYYWWYPHSYHYSHYYTYSYHPYWSYWWLWYEPRHYYVTYVPRYRPRTVHTYTWYETQPSVPDTDTITLAWDLLAAGEPLEARELFAGYAETFEYEGMPWIGYAIASIQLGSYPAAIDAMRRGIANEPQAIDWLPPGGHIRDVIRDARAEMQQLTELEPDHPDLLFMVGVLQALLNEDALAYFALDRAASLGDEHPSNAALRSIMEESLQDELFR